MTTQRDEELESVVAEFMFTDSFGARGIDHLAAARLVLEARRERDEAKSEANSWCQVAKNADAERDAAREEAEDCHAKWLDEAEKRQEATKQWQEALVKVRELEEWAKNVTPWESLKETEEAIENLEHRQRANLGFIEAQARQLLTVEAERDAARADHEVVKDLCADFERELGQAQQERDAALARVRDLQMDVSGRSAIQLGTQHQLERATARIAALEAQLAEAQGGCKHSGLDYDGRCFDCGALAPKPEGGES